MVTATPTGLPALQRLRENLAVVLVALLPLHALLVTVFTRLIVGPNHAPLAWLAFWKEALLVGILAIAVTEITQTYRRERHVPRSDLLDALVVSLFGLAVLSAALLGTPLMKLALGLRYDILAPLSFVILRKVPWSAGGCARLIRAILWVAIGVAAFGLIGLILPLSAFGALGYATNFHSLYLPDSPLAPFSQIGETMIRRAQSSMSGPNQLGIWLAIPIAILRARATHRRSVRRSTGVAGILFIAALFATFSRTAWIAVTASLLGAAAVQLSSKTIRRWFVPVAASIAVFSLIAILAAPKAIVRISSSRGHFEKPLEAIARMTEHPWGEGLASAGPASSRFADACVVLRPEDDPSWAKAQPELCVFLGDKQVQPEDRLCHCPFHPENWYLQLGVELGWLGLLLWVAIIGLTLRRLLPLTLSREPVGTAAAVAQLAMAVASLFLHAWEDAAVAFTIWILTAIALQKDEHSGSKVHS